MDESQAIREAERRNSEMADGDAWQWVAMRSGEDVWVVVKVQRNARIDPLKATTEARPKPSDAPDPRPAIFQNLPPYGAA